MCGLPGGCEGGAQWRRRLASRAPEDAKDSVRARRARSPLCHRSERRRREERPRSRTAEFRKAAGERPEQCPKDRDPVPAMVGGGEAATLAQGQIPLLNRVTECPATSGRRLLIRRQLPERRELSLRTRQVRSPAGVVPALTPRAMLLARVKVGGQKTKTQLRVPVLILNHRERFPMNCSRLLRKKKTRSKRTVCAL